MSKHFTNYITSVIFLYAININYCTFLCIDFINYCQLQYYNMSLEVNERIRMQ